MEFLRFKTNILRENNFNLQIKKIILKEIKKYAK